MSFSFVKKGFNWSKILNTSALPSSFFLCPTGLCCVWLLLLLVCLFSFTSTPCRQVLSSAATRTVSSLLVQYTMMESKEPKRSPFNKDTKAYEDKSRKGREEKEEWKYLKTIHLQKNRCKAHTTPPPPPLIPLRSGHVGQRHRETWSSSHLILFSIHGHRQIQVRRHCCRSDCNAVLITDVQMPCNVQSSGQCCCSC